MKIVNGGINKRTDQKYILELTEQKFVVVKNAVDPWGGNNLDYFVRYTKLGNGVYGLNFKHKNRLSWESLVWIVPAEILEGLPKKLIRGDL